MTEATFIVLVLAGIAFAYRLCVGPTLADRITAMNGVVLVGMGALATWVAHTGNGTFLPTLIVVVLVGPISNGMIARYIETRAE